MIDDIKTIEDCCREVRLGAIPCEIGDILSGYNTISNEYEEWKIVELNKDQWRSKVRRIK